MGSRQGCVLSALLFILFKNNNWDHHSGSQLLIFDSDNALDSLLQRGKVLMDFVQRFHSHFLESSVRKTMDMVDDF